jgi:transcriptional regulator with XRE-family HTH domain
MTPKELRDLRLRAGLTQDELAGLLQRDRMTISRWETGKVKIGRAMAWSIRLLIKEYIETKKD